MNDSRTGGSGSDYSPRPSDRLHIYYFEGIVEAHRFPGDAQFIGNWVEDGCSFLFFGRTADAEIRALCDRQPELILADEFQMTYEQWQGVSFSPFSAGGLQIIPAWEADASPGERRIVLDPGVVFGSGTHPTTRNCLEAVERVSRRGRIATALDLGTGTGVLALAASRLGCDRTLAVDLNGLAVRTTLKNIRLNRLTDRILPVQGRAENFVDCPADLVIANIHYDVMIALVTSRGFLQKRFFVLSGLLRSQAKEIENRLSQYPVRIFGRWSQDGIWHTVAGERCDS